MGHNPLVGKYGVRLHLGVGAKRDLQPACTLAHEPTHEARSAVQASKRLAVVDANFIVIGTSAGSLLTPNQA